MVEMCMADQKNFDVAETEAQLLDTLLNKRWRTFEIAN
jgi:hypothetical protein